MGLHFRYYAVPDGRLDFSCNAPGSWLDAFAGPFAGTAHDYFELRLPQTDGYRLPDGQTEVAPDGSCTLGSGDSLRCAPCGDGVCEPSAGENRCSCPKDCR